MEYNNNAGDKLLNIINQNNETINRYTYEIEKAKINSINGEPVERTGKKEKTSYKFTKKQFIALVLACTMLGGIGTASIDYIVDRAQTNQILYEQTFDLGTDIMESCTKRTNDLQNYWYDYDIMQDQISKSDNQDLAIYAVYRKIGSKVGNAIDGGFTNYITEKGFSSEEEYDKGMKKIIVANEKLEEQTENKAVDLSGKGAK